MLRRRSYLKANNGYAPGDITISPGQSVYVYREFTAAEVSSMEAAGVQLSYGFSGNTMGYFSYSNATFTANGPSGIATTDGMVFSATITASASAPSGSSAVFNLYAGTQSGLSAIGTWSFAVA